MFSNEHGFNKFTIVTNDDLQIWLYEKSYA